MNIDQRDGRVLWRCHAGCTQDAVLGALRDRGLLHDLRDRDGQLVARHERKGRWFQPDGRIGLGGTSPRDLLYGVEILRDAGGRNVVLVEGEKARDALQALGFVTVATVCGAAATPSRRALEALIGLVVYIWPDADDQGWQHMRRVAAILRELGCEVRLIEWSSAPNHGDAADLVATVGSERASAVVEALIAESVPFEASQPERYGRSHASDAFDLDDDVEVPSLPRTPFPTTVFPPAVQRYADRLAVAGLLDFVGPSILTVGAGAIGGRSELQLGPTLRARAIIWTLLVGATGDGKSEPMADAAFPVTEHHERLDDEHQVESELWQAGKRAVEPRQPLGFMLDDVTVEGLREHLRSDSACFALVDEAHGFMKALGQYKRTGGSDRDRWLSLWEGFTWRTRRVGGGLIVVSRPTLSLLGAIQPTRLTVLGSGDDGARARFLMARGGPPKGPRPHPNEADLVAYSNVLAALIRGRHLQRTWVLAADARERLGALEMRMRELARTTSEPDHVTELARKGNKWLHRFVHTLSELWRAELAPEHVGADGLIEVVTVDMAGAVLDYFVDQRRHLDFPRPDLTASLSVRDLDHGVQELREALRSHPNGRLSRRDVIRRRFGGCSSQEGADRLLDRFESVHPRTVREERPAGDRGPLSRVVYDPARKGI